MRRFIVLAVIVSLLIAVGVISRAASASAQPAPVSTGPVCSFVCDKTGVNTGWAIRAPQSDYLRAERLGMNWIMEIAGSMEDVDRTAEAINRANAHGLHAIVRICSGNKCLLGTPELYSEFLHEVASRVDGEFWALMGPNEPDLEHWAGGAVGVARFMNGTLDLVGDIPNLKKLSPAFNLTNRATPALFTTMEKSGARFGELDGFAGTSYNLGGTPAYYYYAHGGGKTYRQRMLRYHIPFIFIETGTFAMTGLSGPNNPRRAQVVAALRKDFGMMVRDPTVMGVLYFNAFGDNPSMKYHVLYDNELVKISQDANCTGGDYNPVGIGYSTNEQLWKPYGAPACQRAQSGCLFVNASACQPGVCVDNDGDGLCGDGNGVARTDCDDADPAIGESCGAGLEEQAVGWGTLRVVDADVPAPQAWASIQLGKNNLPVIGYQSGPEYQGDLTYLGCLIADCTKALRRVLVADNDSGVGLSMQVRPDKRPAFAYLNRTDNYLETFSCNDPGCTSGVVSVKDTGVALDTLQTSLTVLPGGLSIAYWISGSSDLGVLTCLDPDCVSGTPQVREQNGETGWGPSIFTSQSGIPDVVYSRIGARQVWMLRCNSVECTDREAKVKIADGARSLGPSGVAIRPDGRPLILYRRLLAGGEALALYDCFDMTCHHDNDVTSDIYTTTGGIEDASLALLLDGKPFIVFSERNESGDLDLGLIHCDDTACSSSSADKVTDGDAGEHPGVVVRTDGNPLVVYHDVGNGWLMVYDVDLDLVPSPQPVGTPIPIPTDTGVTPTPTATPAPSGPLAPVLKSPAHNGYVRGMPIFRWARSGGARSYQLEYADNFEFSGATLIGMKVTQYKPPAMPKGLYFWHVRACNLAGSCGGWSVTRAVTVALPLPSAPKLASPADGAKVPAGALTLTWKKLAANAASYQVWVSTTRNFTGLVFQAIVSGPDKISVVTDPLPHGVYYWRVRGLNADGEPGRWSAIRRFAAR